MPTKPSILFITDSQPFPPRNGKELPVARFLTELARDFTVDLLVLTNDEGALPQSRPEALPAVVRSIHYARYRLASSVTAGLEELVGGRPAFFTRHFNPKDIEPLLDRMPYDFVWVSPVRALGFVDYCKRHGIALTRRVALGLNDVKTTMYMDGVAEAFTAGFGSYMYHKAWRAIRVPHLLYQERRYLRRCDLIHVQTGLEKKRALRICGQKNDVPRVVAVPNGRKTELESVTYDGVDSNSVLLMTHLSGRRARESTWFIDNVWPEVRRRVPGARLRLVGTPPPASSNLWNRADEGIEIVGFADSLPALYRSVAVSVVPVFHSTGLNNRVLDSLTAGIPIVATPHALGTIDGLKPGLHALAAATSAEFIDALANVLQDRALRMKLAAEARTFGLQQPTWQQGAATLAAALMDLN